MSMLKVVSLIHYYSHSDILGYALKVPPSDFIRAVRNPDFFLFTVCSVWFVFSKSRNPDGKGKPDFFDRSLSLCYTMVGLWICCQQFFAFKNSISWLFYHQKKFFSKLWKLTHFCLNFTSMLLFKTFCWVNM